MHGAHTTRSLSMTPYFDKKEKEEPLTPPPQSLGGEEPEKNPISSEIFASRLRAVASGAFFKKEDKTKREDAFLQAQGLNMSKKTEEKPFLERIKGIKNFWGEKEKKEEKIDATEKNFAAKDAYSQTTQDKSVISSVVRPFDAKKITDIEQKKQFPTSSQKAGMMDTIIFPPNQKSLNPPNDPPHTVKTTQRRILYPLKTETSHKSIAPDLSQSPPSSGRDPEHELGENDQSEILPTITLGPIKTPEPPAPPRLTEQARTKQEKTSFPRIIEPGGALRGEAYSVPSPTPKVSQEISAIKPLIRKKEIDTPLFVEKEKPKDKLQSPHLISLETKPNTFTLQKTPNSAPTQVQRASLSQEVFHGSENIQTPPKPEERPTTHISPIHTYRSDIEQEVKKQKTSFVSIVAAEQRKRAEHRPVLKEKKRTNTALLMLSIFFIAASIGVAGFSYYANIKKNGGVLPVQGPPQSIIFADTYTEFDVTNTTSNDLVRTVSSHIQNKNILLDSVENLYFTRIENGMRRELAAQEFFDSAGLNTPSRFRSAIEGRFMLGMHAFNGNQPFFIFKTILFENAFAEMLSWEATIAREVMPVFGLGAPDRDLQNKKFRDLVIKNKDVRVLEDNGGRTVLLYSFVNRDTLIITTSEDTFLEIVARISLSGR
ncbi:hypothetical protein L0Y46_02275 [bacterium]|nr:hypothetical protein [bacterium]